MNEIHPQREHADVRPARRAVGPLGTCLLAALLFGASTPAAKQFTGSMSPWHMAGLLYAGAGVCVTPWALRGARQMPRASSRQRAYLLGALLSGGVVGPVLLVMGLARAPAASVALWLNLETVATAVLARAFFKEHLGVQTWLSVLLIVFGSVLLSAQTDAGLLPAALVGLACLAWGLDNNLTSLIGSYGAAQITFAKGLLGASVNLGLAAYFGAAAPPASALLLVTLVGALGYGVSLVLYVSSARELGATRSQLVFSTSPAWGLVLSWVAFGEPVLGSQLLAAALMFAAVWLYNRERHAHYHTHEALLHSHWHSHDDGHHEHHQGAESQGWHNHEHHHDAHGHSHAHLPDLHHRHRHEQ
jgi:drug/metabolite transporter (DMT)-like permease